MSARVRKNEERIYDLRNGKGDARILRASEGEKIAGQKPRELTEHRVLCVRGARKRKKQRRQAPGKKNEPLRKAITRFGVFFLKKEKTGKGKGKSASTPSGHSQKELPRVSLFPGKEETSSKGKSLKSGGAKAQLSDPLGEKGPENP